MFNYLLKRILIMIPTLFAICIVVFVIINIAPGKPGGQLLQAEGSSDAGQGKKREAYKIFKEQFNLDKPIMFNTWFFISTKDITDKIYKIANLDGKFKTADSIKAQDDLEDYGKYSVKPLIEFLKKTQTFEYQNIAVQYLSLNARQKLIKPYADLNQITINERELNRLIDQRNRYVSTLVFPNNADSKEQSEIIVKWYNWFNDHKDEYEFSTYEKAQIFITDTRFAKYITNVFRLDFGISHVTKKPVLKTIISKMKYSITLSFLAIFFSYLISLPIGIYSATHSHSKGDKAITVTLFVFYSLPSFFIGTLLLMLFSQGGVFRIFPTGGFMSPFIDKMTTLEQLKDLVWHLILPVICLTYGSLAALSRYARTGLLEVIRSDYIRTARAKGLPEKVVVLRHALRNGMIPILTLLASLLPILIGGSVIIETIFNIPGIGLFVYESIFNRDYNAIMAVQLMTATLTLFGIFLSDLSYALVDPRIKFK